MSDSLTTLISKVQALLGDDGTIFTTATITAAARKALATYNQYLPTNAGTLIDAVTDQLEYELTDEDPLATGILDILEQDSDQQEMDISITFDQYHEDNRIFFRLRSPLTTGKTIIARYNIPQTINGLDSATETTIPAWMNDILITGIAGEALRSRAYARVEKINLNKDVSENYKALAKEFLSEYKTDLKRIAQDKQAPVGEPDNHAWNDPYHNWNQ